MDLSSRRSLAKGEGSSELGFDAFLFSSMRVMIVVNMVAALVGARHMWRTSPTAELSAAYLSGVRLGILIFLRPGSREEQWGSPRLQHAVGVKDGGPGSRF